MHVATMTRDELRQRRHRMLALLAFELIAAIIVTARLATIDVLYALGVGVILVLTFIIGAAFGVWIHDEEKLGTFDDHPAEEQQQ